MINNKSKTYKINGMDCDACAKMIELDLEDAGISAKCSYQKSQLEIAEKHNTEKVIEIVSKAGYTLQQQ